LRHKTDLTGSGRTDAGVHAKGQVAHFDTLEPIDPSRLSLNINALLPPDIRILEVLAVDTDFHARYSALSKIYHYHLHLGPIVDPFIHPYRHILKGACDIDRMKQGAHLLLGTHDFSFVANRTKEEKNGVRTLYRLDLIEEAGGIRLEFEANGFLYKMVRNLTGLLISVGTKRIQPEDVAKVLTGELKQPLFRVVPPQGLFLYEVNYHQSLPTIQNEQSHSSLLKEDEKRGK
jgi:tRNA pseudouridine38-40 synthase